MKGKTCAFAIKVDLSKAYDKLSWEFIWRTLQEIQIPANMMHVIMHSVTSIETNVNWNGTRNTYFRPKRGIRQGDPISPYLFVLCMDKLSHLIEEEVMNKRWKGIKLGKNGIKISHLMFADDLLIFGEATENQMKCVMDTLEDFCCMSGKEISMENTSIMFSKNVSQSMQRKLQDLSKLRSTKSFGRYLGVPLSGKKLKKNDFLDIVDQIVAKLNGWKKNTLSLAGRITLTKSVIKAIPLYPMMTNKLPKSIIDMIHGLQRSFAWGDTDEKRRIHAVGWEKVTMPKHLGGVGLRDLSNLNKACLMKLGWKVYNNSEEFWCKVLKSKYRILDSNDCEKIRANDSSLWKDIARNIPYMIKSGRWILGDGRSVRAWDDNWLGKEYCVRNYDVIIPENLRRAHVCDLVMDDGNWNFSILNNWLLVQWIEKLKTCLPPNTEQDTDVFCFAGGRNNEDFSIRDMFNELEGYPDEDIDGDWNKIWKASVPKRCKTFLWMLKHNRLLTNQSKSNKGLGSAGCNLCGAACESSLHALRDCYKCVHFWESLVPSELALEFFSADLAKWISLNLNHKGNNNFDWCNIWIMACHALWTWRNQEEHDENFERPVDPINHIFRRNHEYHQALQVYQGARDVGRRNKMMGWQIPTKGMIKLNTDGASKNGNIAGCGGVIRDEMGNWCGGFAKYLGRCSAILAEMWGVYEGVKLINHLGFKKVEINIDAMEVVEALNHGVTGKVECAAMLRQILQQLKMMDTVIISHVYRNENACTDCLANYGCNNMRYTFFERAHEFLVNHLENDVAGILNSSIVV